MEAQAWFLADWARCRRSSLVGTISAKHAFDAVLRVDKLGIPGDLLEAGVWKGGMSCLMVEAHMRSSANKRENTRRTSWLYDTFEGLPQPSEEDGKRAKEVWSMVNDINKSLSKAWLLRRGIGARDVKQHKLNWGPMSDVVWTMNRTSFVANGGAVRYVRGKVEETMADARTPTHEPRLPERVAVMRLDTDWYNSTQVELQALWPRLSPGGFMEIDDYYAWGGAQRAVDEWLSRNGWRSAADAVGAFLPKHQHERRNFVWKSNPYSYASPFARVEMEEPSMLADAAASAAGGRALAEATAEEAPPPHNEAPQQPPRYRPVCMIKPGATCHHWRAAAHLCRAGVDVYDATCRRGLHGEPFNCSDATHHNDHRDAEEGDHDHGEGDHTIHTRFAQNDSSLAERWARWRSMNASVTSGSTSGSRAYATGSYAATPRASGVWRLDAAYIYNLDLALADSLARFFLEEAASVVEFGGGLGCYAGHLLDARVRSVAAYDGIKLVRNRTHGLVHYADLTTPGLRLPAADWVLCLAVAEHIPKQFEATLLDNLARHARRGVVISWGRGVGNGHVNIREPAYVHARLAERGFVADFMGSKRLNKTLWWFRSNVFIYRRNETVTGVPLRYGAGTLFPGVSGDR